MDRDTVKFWDIFNHSQTWKIYVIGDTLSRAAHAAVSIVQDLSIYFDDIIGSYDMDKLYDLVYKCYKSEKSQIRYSDEVLKDYYYFVIKIGKRNYQKKKICVPREPVLKALKVAHDAKTVRHFGFSKLCQRVACLTGNIGYEMLKTMLEDGQLVNERKIS